ncbi:MAG: hypothetical protein OEY29_16145 [Gammaproteobacteria bacterium]|nr:hypothetical protein [Gammaproteobacteria bacterium]
MALLSDYYANPDTGNDTTGDGTLGNPFASIQHCIDVAIAEAASNFVTAASGLVTLHAVGSGDLGSAAISTGITMDATNHIVLQGITSTTALKLDTSLPYLAAGPGSPGCNIESEFVDAFNMQCLNAGSSAYGFLSTVPNLFFKSCVVSRDTVPTTGNQYGWRMGHTFGSVALETCLVYGLEASASSKYASEFYAEGDGGHTNFRNCLAGADTSLAGYSYGFSASSLATTTLTNCYSSSKGQYPNTGATIVTSAATGTEGSPAALDSIAFSAANFEDPLNATLSLRDLTLVAGTVLEDGSEATDLSAFFTTDFFGNTITTWPIGPAAIPFSGVAVSRSLPGAFSIDQTTSQNLPASFSSDINVDQAMSIVFESLHGVSSGKSAVFSIGTSLVAVSNSLSAAFESLQGVVIDRSAPVSVIQGLIANRSGVFESVVNLVVVGPAAFEVLKETRAGSQASFEAVKLIQAASSTPFEFIGSNTFPTFEYLDMQLSDSVNIDAYFSDNINLH